MLTASISMVDLNVRLTKDIEATAKLSLILTNATMAVPSVISTLNVKILTAQILVHATMNFFGDGRTCSDINECYSGINDCDKHASCMKHSW